MIIDKVDFIGEVGASNIRKLVKEFIKTAGADNINIVLGKRTAGANTGKTSKPFTIVIND